MAIRLATLGSGSGGNATLVEGGGARVLIDAGFSCRRLVQRLRFVGLDPAAVDAILLTHEHGDHVAGAATFAASFGTPIYCTRGTAAAAGFTAGGLTPVIVRDGGTFAIAGMQVLPFAVPHDVSARIERTLRHSCSVIRVRGAGCNPLTPSGTGCMRPKPRAR